MLQRLPSVFGMAALSAAAGFPQDDTAQTDLGTALSIVDDTQRGIGPGGGGGRRTLFESLFSAEGPPPIHRPGFSSAVEQLAPAVGNGSVRILFAEGPGELVPSLRFVTTIPRVDVERMIRLVQETEGWADWIPMLGAIEVHQSPDANGKGVVQRLALSIEGVAAKLLGLGTLRVTSRIEEERHDGIAQSRWGLVDADEGDLAFNRGSWTLVPLRDQGVAAVYEGHQVLRWIARQNRVLRAPTVAVLRKQARGHLRTMVESLAQRAVDPTWTKRSDRRPVGARFVVEDV